VAKIVKSFEIIVIRSKVFFKNSVFNAKVKTTDLSDKSELFQKYQS